MIAPPGWSEPFQTPEFDEYTFIIKGKKRFTIEGDIVDVEAGQRLTVQMYGGSGDADLYLRFGSKPTINAWDCRPFRYGNSETCTVNATQSGRYHVMIQGYSSYNGVSIQASY